MHFPQSFLKRRWFRPECGSAPLGLLLLIALGCVATTARGQDENYSSLSGGTVRVTGNLSTDGFIFTHTLPNSTTVSGGLFVPDVTNYVSVNGEANFTSVTVAGATTALGDVRVGNATSTGPSFGGIVFVDNNDHVSAGVDGAGLNLAQGNGGTNLGPHAVFAVTDETTGNSLVVSPANFTLTVLGAHQSGSIPLLGGGGAPGGYASSNLTMDFSNAGQPFIQLFAPAGSAQLTGVASAATLNFVQIGGNNLTVNPGGEAIAFNGGFVINGTAPGAPFLGVSVALGNNAWATGTGAVASGNRSASGNLAVALGNNSGAFADGAVALAGGSAFGANAVALGWNATATANNAVAVGTGVSVQNWGAVVVGRNNRPVAGNATAWSASDPALIVGTGVDGTTSGQANTLVIYNNGSLVLGAPANLANGAGNLQVNGAAVFNGQATFSGNVILSHPHGDISPGIYSH